MSSISDIFRIGRGPSSSHTIGPGRASLLMMERYPDCDRFRVTLYGSLAKTGRGHGTDRAIAETFGDIPCEILWEPDTDPGSLPHPNTMRFEGFTSGEKTADVRIMSIGGGAIQVEGEEREESSGIYSETTFGSIAEFCRQDSMSLSDYVFYNEPGIKEHLRAVWAQMRSTIIHGLEAEGTLPGGLEVKRRAKDLYIYGSRNRDLVKKERFLISAYAYASSEENASTGMMVTAPTCGACGVLPAVLYYEQQLFAPDEEQIISALAVAGIIGQVIRTNASVSGAQAGCQAEVGSACSMAAGALCSLRGLGMENIECAAELAMEHCLGLTCDPVGGLVQIPCIERNAVGALRAYDAASLSEVIFDNRKVSFDDVVLTMYETGKDLSSIYRETSEGGLARLYVNKP
ncbi:MAG: L-serine ammonia-lyase, iron-sulfur-dependent, subunit alpha [Eubacteriaceae bacterium]|nr:L-serine ammonia-lyase, iron-sulfur-dependent, subunit alpha [Eubacteriaceae bacterium]